MSHLWGSIPSRAFSSFSRIECKKSALMVCYFVDREHLSWGNSFQSRCSKEICDLQISRLAHYELS